MAFNAKSPTIKRILQESRELSRTPDPSLTASPLENNLFEWHFTLTGPPSTPYAEGIYHGRIILPPSYPLRPPAFRFLTPSGRFETNREICLSISGHHEETWQPAWGIRTALCAIRAFMAGDAKGQVGGLDMHPEAREKLARESRGWRCAGCGARTNEEVMSECEERWRESTGGKEGEREEQKVPEELRLGYREEVEGKDGGKGEGKVKTGEEDIKVGEEKESQIEEGARQAATEAVATPPPSTPAQAQRVPFTPRSPTAHLAPTPTTATTLRPRREQQDLSGPPEWIDKAIVGVALALLLMFIKRVVGMME